MGGIDACFETPTRVQRFGTAPFLECGSEGDRRFRAAYARVRCRGNRSIHDIYCGVQVYPGDLSGVSPEDAAGIVQIHRREVEELYGRLWDEYFSENPQLLERLCAAGGVSDSSGSQDAVSPAAELWRIRTEVMKACV